VLHDEPDHVDADAGVLQVERAERLVGHGVHHAVGVAHDGGRARMRFREEADLAEQLARGVAGSTEVGSRDVALREVVDRVRGIALAEQHGAGLEGLALHERQQPFPDRVGGTHRLELLERLPDRPQAPRVDDEQRALQRTQDPVVVDRRLDDEHRVRDHREHAERHHPLHQVAREREQRTDRAEGQRDRETRRNVEQ
jgi:hypothetical protein